MPANTITTTIPSSPVTVDSTENGHIRLRIGKPNPGESRFTDLTPIQASRLIRRLLLTMEKL